MQRIWRRLTGDYQLAIITSVGFLGLVALTPFAIYRLSHADWLVGAVDIFLILSTCTAVAYAWRTGDTLRPGQFLAAFYSTAAVLVAINLGVDGLFWFYVMIVFNFFVVPPLQSTIATLLALAALSGYSLAGQGHPFEDLPQLVSFAITAIITSVFAMIFAARGRVQRRQLHELATIDPLTGIGNRRALETELVRVFAEHTRYGTAYGLLVLDLDHFKRINDTFGHKAGDRVLRDFVSIVDSACRQSDRLFRFGGEEFVLLAPQVDLDGLEQVARNILRTVQAELRNAEGGEVTVSIGGAQALWQADYKSWLHSADECLYQAKHAGRNTIVIDGAGAKRQPTLSDCVQAATP
ncbi:GGDEF domain-containing protein [Pseudomonas sp. gcc21]|uniref:GGDEF domain-containing protein n=1 Tax=Pseudomonas sp. gcc21 TaxID=2726989 RepID=UPI0014523E30|nr:GGDEF domain-containing protein [Pseudomonas sp. gcc21]QJD58336.1 GGDEF domain-containing protein [Pseudomonas sp. gcc21]